MRQRSNATFEIYKMLLHSYKKKEVACQPDMINNSRQFYQFSFTPRKHCFQLAKVNVIKVSSGDLPLPKSEQDKTNKSSTTVLHKALHWNFQNISFNNIYNSIPLCLSFSKLHLMKAYTNLSVRKQRFVKGFCANFIIVRANLMQRKLMINCD